MVWTSSVVTLGTASVQVVPPDNMPHDITLHNMTKSSNEYIHIGPNSSTTINNSIHIDPGETLTIRLRPNDELWACSDPSGLVLGIADVRMAD